MAALSKSGMTEDYSGKLLFFIWDIWFIEGEKKLIKSLIKIGIKKNDAFVGLICLWVFILVYILHISYLFMENSLMDLVIQHGNEWYFI